MYPSGSGRKNSLSVELPLIFANKSLLSDILFLNP
jgi:hypothetical protein